MCHHTLRFMGFHHGTFCVLRELEKNSGGVYNSDHLQITSRIQKRKFCQLLTPTTVQTGMTYFLM